MDIKTLLFFCACLFSVSLQKRLSLKKIIILSRHNVRTPLSKYLGMMTPKPWPEWKQKSGHLTEKGAILEGHMGKYFSTWLNNEGFLPEGCPSEEIFYAYANSKQRTLASAQAFVINAFPNCNITIHNTGKAVDPIFNPVIHNDSTIFRDNVIEEMTERLKNLNLNSSYEHLDSILDYKHSKICLNEHKCDLKTDKNKIINVIYGEKPNVSGPLKIGNSVIDAFIMQYYEGFPMNDVAWGEIKNSGQWEDIMKLSRGYHNVIFNTTLVAKDIAYPLIKYLSHIFLNDENKPKITLLMGHDANMYTILNGMGFKTYSLKNQHEITPVGGKIVFQKWYDDEMRRNLLKMYYVYQSTDQLRMGTKLSVSNPPQFSLLELKKCVVDSKGFCLWDDFKKLLKNLY